MKAIKGFNRDMTCRGFHFAEGQTYTHDGPVEACRSGFHAVTMPLHVLQYYPPATSVYHQVELDDTTEPEKDGDSKVAGRVIKIGARLELPALIKAQVDFVFANAKTPGKNGVSRKDHGIARSRNENGAATASGYCGAATASGYYGAATASGYYGAATASGDNGAATASGYYGAATASGDNGAATASGDQSVGIVTGKDGRARGVVGSWIVLTERDADWKILGVQAVAVDGETVKADTWYALRGGRVVEA